MGVDGCSGVGGVAELQVRTEEALKSKAAWWWTLCPEDQEGPI